MHAVQFGYFRLDLDFMDWSGLDEKMEQNVLSFGMFEQQ